MKRVSKRDKAFRESVQVAQESVQVAKRNVLTEPARVRNSMQVQNALLNLNQSIEEMERTNTAEGVLRATELLEELKQAQQRAEEEVAAEDAKAPKKETVVVITGEPMDEPKEKKKASHEDTGRRFDFPRESVHVQFRPKPREIIRAPELPKARSVKLTNNDALYGETAMIDGIWIFEEKINPDHLTQGILEFITENPTFAGRMDPTMGAVRLSNKGVPFTVQYATGSWEDVPEDPEPHYDWLDRRDLDGVWQGKEPVMTVCLTQMRKGGSVLGVAVSHGVVGGSGFFGVCMPRLATFTQAAAGKIKMEDLKEGSLGSIRPLEDRSAFPASPKRSLKEMNKVIKSLEYQPLVFHDPVIGQLKRNLFYFALKSAVDRPRRFVHFTKEELDAIKTEASKDLKTAKFLSTGESLVAHLVRIMASCVPLKQFKPTHIAAICDHTSRLKGLPKGYIGNMFYIYSIEFPTEPDKMTLSELAELVHNKMQAIFKDPARLIEHMQLQEELIAHGYQPNPKLSLALPFVFNQQAKFKPLIQLDFGSGVCKRYIPHNAGDSILCVPAQDGGIDAWLSTVNAVVGDASAFVTDEILERLHEFRP